MLRHYRLQGLSCLVYPYLLYPRRLPLYRDNARVRLGFKKPDENFALRVPVVHVRTRVNANRGYDNPYTTNSILRQLVTISVLVYVYE